MPTFRFYVADNAEPSRGPIDVELASAEDARMEAIRLLAEIAYDVLPDGDLHDFYARVTDGIDGPLFEAVLSLRARWLIDDVGVPGDRC